MWLEPKDWEHVQAVVPIVCVDMLPIRDDLRVGLIWRETPAWGNCWCLVGGRLQRNETIVEALHRQCAETLGPGTHIIPSPDIQPIYVTQYFPERREVGGVDPRQHAVSLIYVVVVTGRIRPQGEALGFKWFARDDLPAPEAVGFEQHGALEAVIARL